MNKNRSTFLWVLMTLLMVSVVVLSSCGAPSPAAQTQAPAATQPPAKTEAPAALPGEGVDVTWCYTAEVNELVYQRIPMIGLERLGYNVANPPNTLSVPLAYEATSTGDCDAGGFNWSPLQDSFYEPVKDKTTQVGKILQGALQGYLIDKKTADEYGITNIDQLKDPEIAKLFDKDGNGKADLYGAEPGWGAEKWINYQLDKFGLTDSIDHKQGGYWVLIADAISRYQNGEPVLFYAFTPGWALAKMIPGKDVVWLDVPFNACPENPDCDTSTPDGHNGGWGLNDINILANTEFLEKNPAAKRFLEQVTVPIEFVNTENLWISEGQNTDKDVERHANEWIAENQELFDSWIEEALKAGGQ